MAGKRKFCASEVLAICAEYEGGASISALALKRTIPYEAIRQILHCRTYKEIRRPVVVRKPGVRKAA